MVERSVKQLKLIFVFAGFAYRPIGGYKVAYQYVNFLSERGHKVQIVHGISKDAKATNDIVARFFSLVFKRFRKCVLPWFNLSKAVQVNFIGHISNLALQDSDAVVLVGFTATQQLNKSNFQNIPGGGIFVQLDQHPDLLNITSSFEEIVGVFKQKNILHVSIPGIVQEMLSDIGLKSHAIAPGVDSEKFYHKGINSQKLSVLTFKSNIEHKAFSVAVEAMRYVHHEMPEVDFYCFGSETVLDIPDWITDLGYLSDEKLSDAYNRSSIFLVASSEEGFGLTALEAMSCGSVVVSTKNGGVQSFLEDGVNSKLAEIGDSAGLAESCIVILRDRNLLRELSVNAVSASANYSLDVSNSKFEEFLLNLK